MRGRSAVVLALGLLLCLVLRTGDAGAAELPETARPLAARESTPLCSSECELITAPTEAASGREYEGSGPGGGFSPQELREAYGLPEHGGAGVTVAVVDDLGDAEAERGLAVYREEFGLPPCTEANGCFHQVNEHGVAHRPASFGGWVGEISLDLDMVSAGCPECNILLVEGSGRAGRVEAIKAAVELGADVVTNSWNFGFEESNPANSAACEYELCISSAEEQQYDPKFDFPGVPIIFSGGDYGYGVRYPADSPNVIAVGGTRLRHEADGSRPWSEEAWANPAYGKDEKGRGTGGGCSVFEQKPAWQTDTACAKRVADDIAADADPRSPVAVYSAQDGWRLVGGTSASAPFIAGVEGLSTGASRRGGAEAIWRAGAAGSFFDVSGGSIGTCTPPAADAYWCAALAGFDGPTGWGTPNGPLDTPGPPELTTEPASAVGTTGATLHALVRNDGAPGGTTCTFQVAASSDPAFAAPLRSLPCNPGTVASEASVTASLTGLSPHTTYLFRAEGSNGEGGPISGGTQSLRTSVEPPEEGLEPAGPVTRTGAELRAKINNKGAPGGTTCGFELAHDGDYKFQSPFETVPCTPGQIEGEGFVPVTATVSGLAVNTTYLWRLTSISAGGSADWIAEEFTTLPEPPAVTTGGATVTSAGAELAGRVDDEGDLPGSSCAFQVARATDPTFSAPVATVLCDPATVTGETEVAVEGAVATLAPSTGYLYRLRATNRGGTSTGATRAFTTGTGAAVEPVKGPEHPVIVTGPPDEKEEREARERKEAQEAATRRAGETPPGQAVAPTAAPSDRFTLGRPSRRGAAILVPVTLPGPGIVTVMDGGSVRRTTDQAIAAGTLTIRVPLSSATARHAARDPKLRLSLVVTFAPVGGAPATKKLDVTVGRRPSGR